MTSRKPPSKLDRLLKSHLKLLRAHRGVIDTMGHLRVEILQQRETLGALQKLMLEMRAQANFPDACCLNYESCTRTCIPRTNEYKRQRDEARKEYDVPRKSDERYRSNYWPRL